MDSGEESEVEVSSRDEFSGELPKEREGLNAVSCMHSFGYPSVKHD